MESKNVGALMNINIKIPKDAEDYVLSYAAANNIKKGEAIRRLSILAWKNPNVTPATFQGGDTKSATLRLSVKEFSATSKYRSTKKLVNKTDFFRDSLMRGITVSKVIPKNQEGGGEGN